MIFKLVFEDEQLSAVKGHAAEYCRDVRSSEYV